MNKAFIVLTTILLSSSCRTQEPQREGFVSLSPSATEIIYKLEVENKLKAVSDYCDWPPQVKEKISAGGMINPSFEKIVSLNPRVVFMLSGMPAQIKNSLQKAGIEVMETHAQGLEGVYSDIERIARLSGKVKQGRQLISKIKENIEEIAHPGDTPAKRVYVEISANPVMSPGGQSHINQMIRKAGGHSVSAGENRDYILSGVEYIISQKPHIILILSEGGRQRVNYLEEILKDSVPASSEGNIFYIENKDIILRPGPRIVEGIKKLSRYISPDNLNEK